MLKKVSGKKEIFLSAGLVMVMALSGCAGDPAKRDGTDAVVYEEDQETENAERISTDHTPDSVETTVPAKDGPEAKEAPAQKGAASQPQAETSVKLTDNGKTFLAQMCNQLNDFNSGQAMDEKFWRDFLFYSYTGGTSENAVTKQVYREDLGFEETVVKVSLQEAQEHVKLVFGVELPDLKPSFEDMEEGQTSFYYKDGYYYIGVSGLPDYQYTFSECMADKENGTNTIVKYTVDFMGENNVGTVTFGISPEKNENGFVIRSKITEFSK